MGKKSFFTGNYFFKKNLIILKKHFYISKIFLKFAFVKGGRFTLFQSIGSLIFHKTPHIELIKHNNTTSHLLLTKHHTIFQLKRLIILSYYFALEQSLTKWFLYFEFENSKINLLIVQGV